MRDDIETLELSLFPNESFDGTLANKCQTFKDCLVRKLEDNKATYRFIYELHYAKRKPSISFAFGLYDKFELIGICTFGMPASPQLCVGVAGPKNKNLVIELNRLVLKYNRKNEASFLVGRALKMMPKPKIVVSYADTQQKHVGTVYQATNFMFTGTTKPRTDMASDGNKHSRHNLNDATKRVFRSAKHRYVYILGNKQQKKNLLRDLRYSVIQYPKQT